MGIITPIMGTRQHSVADKSEGLAGALFSKTQQRVLGVLFGNPDRSFYSAEIIARARGGTGTVLRELARLEASGLITAHRVGNQRHYQANPQSPVFEELRSIIAKTVGVADPLRQAFKRVAPKITAAFVYGSVARQKDTAHSDIDLIIISDRLAYADVYPALESVGKAVGRQVNPTIYTRAEFKKRVKARNAFVTKVLGLPKLWIIGSENDFAA
jgi:predicted nucleotidyltransferase